MRLSELAKLIGQLVDPPHGPLGELISLDLAPKANAKLTQPFQGEDGVVADNLAELPRGEQVFAGVRFRIADALIQLRGKHLPERPERVEGISVEKTFKKLYIFHGTGLRKKIQVKDGTIIGRYEVRYQDNSRATIPVTSGEDVRDWRSKDQKPLARGKLGWVGTNPKARLFLRSRRLYVTLWENLHPEKKVATIDFISTGTCAARRMRCQSRRHK